MSSVQRWSHEHPTECVQVRYEYGSWVRYEDHERAVAVAVAAEREACELEVIRLMCSEVCHSEWCEALGKAADAIHNRGQA